ncbi:hypothetical protein GCM10007383_12460 [Arenibacter certesii]|uniref:Uncharacterized protein n=1 Tax=Arenibacter certesii TaxID=228955 RepID=A0A918IRG0_9FLAO|nr:hypothetical protein GCM10007383_12460 [Arenibacter certesii]
MVNQLVYQIVLVRPLSPWLPESSTFVIVDATNSMETPFKKYKIYLEIIAKSIFEPKSIKHEIF